MFRGVARVVVYLLLIVPLVVIAVLISKQINFAFALRKDFIDGNTIKIPYADMQQIMAASEVSTRSFFLIFICFLMIMCGLLLVMRSTEHAFSTSREPRIKYSLRPAYPGVVLAIFGCLLLAYSVYKSSRIQIDATEHLISIRGKGVPASPAETEVRENSDLADPDTAAAPAVPGPQEERVEEVVTVPVSGRPEAVRGQPATVSAQESHPEVAEVHSEEIIWADQLATRSVAYGYYPTRAEGSRYADIARRLKQTEGAQRLNPELEWAFRLLQRAHGGYQPSFGELERYESVVRNYVGKKDKRTTEEKSAGLNN